MVINLNDTVIPVNYLQMLKHKKYRLGWKGYTSSIRYSIHNYG